MNMLQIKHQQGHLRLSRSVSSLIKNHWCVSASFWDLLCQSKTSMPALCAWTDIVCRDSENAASSVRFCFRWQTLEKHESVGAVKRSNAEVRIFKLQIICVIMFCSYKTKQNKQKNNIKLMRIIMTVTKGSSIIYKSCPCLWCVYSMCVCWQPGCSLWGHHSSDLWLSSTCLGHFLSPQAIHFSWIWFYFYLVILEKYLCCKSALMTQILLH